MALDDDDYTKVLKKMLQALDYTRTIMRCDEHGKKHANNIAVTKTPSNATKTEL